MSDDVDFVLGAPTARDTLWEGVYFTCFADDLSQVAWLVESLRLVLCREVSCAVDSSCKFGTVRRDVVSQLEVNDSDKLLVELACPVVNTGHRGHVSLVNPVMLCDLRV